MERKIIFPALRWICAISIMLIISGNIILIVMPTIFIPDDKIKIDYSDVKKSLLTNKTYKAEKTIFLKNYNSLSERQKKTINKWINKLSNHEEQQNFCDGLDEVISKAFDDKNPNITFPKAMDRYKNLYFNKIKVTSPIETQIKKASKVILILSSLFAVILLTGILGILAIERNTRIK